MSGSVSDIYGGDYLNASVVKNKSISGKLLEIQETNLETIRDGRDRLVVTFANLDKKLILNKTNAQLLADVFGEDYTSWKGHKLSLQITKVNYQGDLVPSMVVVPNVEASR